jgi:hypothetical protein
MGRGAGLSLMLVASGKAALGFCGRDGVRHTRRPHANGRADAAMARSAAGALRGRRTGRGPLSRLAGTRARTLAALVYAASESTPPHPHAELELSAGLDGRIFGGKVVALFDLVQDVTRPGRVCVRSADWSTD